MATAFLAKVPEKMSADALIVFHIFSERNLQTLREVAPSLRKRMIVISSHPKIRIQDKSSFLDVVEVYSNHPNLGGYAADAINRGMSGVAAASDY